MGFMADLLDWVNPVNYVTPKGWKKMYSFGERGREKERQRQEAERQQLINKANTKQDAIISDSSERARQLLISGNPQRLIASSGLTGNTGSGGSTRKRLIGV